jgi:hypothetical protein
MKYGLGGSLSHIAVAAIEITILISRTKNVPTRAFLAFPNNVDIANDRDIAVLIHTIKRIIIGPGLIETISRRNAAAARRNIAMERNAEIKKST